MDPRTLAALGALAIAALGALASAGCGGDTTHATIADATADTATDAAPTDAPPTEVAPGETADHCTPSYTPLAADKTNIGSIAAQLVDGGDAPLAGVPVSVCGIDLCVSGSTDANGHASLTSGRALTKPAFGAGDGRYTPRLLWPLTATSGDLGALTSARLPEDGAPLAAGASATSGDVTLTIAAAATIVQDELSYPTAHDQELRAVTLPLAREAALLAGTGGVGAVYGLGPNDALVCPPAALVVPNTPGWPAGAAVEVLLLGTDVSEAWAPYGGWAKIADAAVAPDGATIATLGGSGLPVLGTIALRRP